MSTDIFETVGPKLGRFVRLLASPIDGEVVAAARALGRTLAGAGLDFHALADHVARDPDVITIDLCRPTRSAPRPPSVAPLWEQLRRQDRLDWLATSLGCPSLSEWERQFAGEMRGQCYSQPHKFLSPKQRAAANKIFAKTWLAGVCS